jgi:hypothetical protein
MEKTDCCSWSPPYSLLPVITVSDFDGDKNNILIYTKLAQQKYNAHMYDFNIYPTG